MKQVNPDISIIVPIYNAENYIKKCIDSLIHQTKQELEFILVNDGSTDHTEEILLEYKDKRIKYFKNKNQGIGKTRNFGISKATGKYLMFVDSDDFLEKDACEVLYKKALQEDSDLVICDFYKLYENGTLEEGNIAVIDFEGFKDGKPFDGGKSENYSLTIGSGQFIPGFEDGLIGMKVNEERELKLTFPENYPSEELKGQEVTFKVKLNEIKERIFPEMNEEFFKDLNLPDVDSEEKLREELKNNIKTHKERHIEDEYIEKCLEEVNKTTKIDIPEEMTNEEVDRMIDDFRNQISMQGMDFDTYLQMIKSSVDDLKKNFKDEANKRISYRLIIEAVSKKESIEVTEKEIDDHLSDMSKRYNMTVEELIKNIGSRDYVKYDLQVKKALELIIK